MFRPRRPGVGPAEPRDIVEVEDPADLHGFDNEKDSPGGVGDASQRPQRSGLAVALPDTSSLRGSTRADGALWLTARNSVRLGTVWLTRHLGLPPLSMPILLAFATMQCNLKCSMCAIGEASPNTQPEGELTTDEWKAVVDSAALLGTMIISWTGGENLLRPDIFELLGYTREQGIAVHVSTNATRLDRQAARMFNETTHSVSISVDGPDAASHEALRGRGAFKATMRGIQLLREEAPGLRLGLNFVITTQNYRRLVEMLHFAEKVGARQVKFAPIHANLLHSDKPMESYEHLFFKPSQLSALDAEIERLLAAARYSPLQINSAGFMRRSSELYSTGPNFNCYAGYAVGTVSATGEVLPCSDFKEGINVRDKTLFEIWRSPSFHRIRRKVHTCSSNCWDTTHTELSLRLSARSRAATLSETWRDLRFYFDNTIP